MSAKKHAKAQANSVKAALPSSSGFGGGFGSPLPAFGASASKLSYLAEQPDVSSLPDPNLVVIFRNFAKKDSTTKAKALEELQTYISTLRSRNEEVDESSLNAWIKVYPRLSIEVDRRVRQLSHSVQGAIFSNSGKKAARYMHECVGSWVAGCYETDRVVSKAAQDAFGTVFPTLEKRESINKVYQPSILAFCKEALLVESAKSLSDDRTTKPEDSDAKYFRLVASALAVVRILVEKLVPDDIRKHTSAYQELLESGRLWAFAELPDSAVRRSLLRLIPVCLTRIKEVVQPMLSTIFQALFSKRSIKSQGGSALEFSTVLLALTTAQSELWLILDKEPTSASSRFGDLIKHGSQGASAMYWTNLSSLFRGIPIECLPTTVDAAMKILSATKTGITRKDEPRMNATEAWNCYDTILGILLHNLQPVDQDRLLSEMALVIVGQFLNPTQEHASWTITAKQPATHVAKLFALPRMADVSEAAYPRMAEALIETIQTSAPEQSKDFDRSQTAVSQAGSRWFELQRNILATSKAEPMQPILADTSYRIMSESVKLLTSRNGKPFGAAGVIDAALRQTSSFILAQEQVMALLDHFIAEDLPGIILSPSSSHLVSILYRLQSSARFDESLAATLNIISGVTDSEQKEETLRLLVTEPKAPKSVLEAAANNENLQAYFSRLIEKAMQGNGNWNTIAQYLTSSSPAFSRANIDTTLADLTTSLTLTEEASDAISGLETVSDANAGILQDFVKTDQGTKLVQNLLSLLESTDPVLVQRATALNARLSATNGAGVAPAAAAAQSVLAHGLREAGPHSLAVETLVDFARNASIETQDPTGGNMHSFLPAVDEWKAALADLINLSVPQSLADSDDLGAAIFLLQQPAPPNNSITYDRDGYSAALRMGMFSVSILEETSTWQTLDTGTRADYYQLLVLTAQLANDCLSVSSSNAIFYGMTLLAESQVADFVSIVGRLVATWTTRAEEAFVEEVQSNLFEAAAGSSPIAFRSARVYSYTAREVTERRSSHHGMNTSLEDKYKELRKTSTPMQLLAFIKGFESILSLSTIYSRACNELVASLTTVDISRSPGEALQQLVLINAMLLEQDHIVEAIAKQRLIFLVKHITSWLEDTHLSPSLRHEVTRLLTVLLPAIKEVYGEHWAECLSYIEKTCSSSRPTAIEVRSSAIVPLLHATLKLLTSLRNLTLDEDCNEDLTDTWQERLPDMALALLGLLKHQSAFSDAQNQPLRQLNELLGRQIAALPAIHLVDTEELYSVVASESQPAQETAFTILHKRIPTMQEQISVDTALDRTSARLPEELLSLILEPLTLDSLIDASFDREIPSQARAYMSAWLLIFDHFRNASDRVVNDYGAHLKEGDYLSPLLDFIADFLGHSRGKPVDASPFEVTIYSSGVQEDPLKDMQWLLIHLYYLALKRLPTLAKAWWSDCRSRQTVQNIESWTQKYISPSVISDALETVSRWAETQDSNSDDAVIIKTNLKAKEITLAKELDAQLLALGIKLPPNYPLGLATCYSINRVAVEEKKWNSWRLNTQGVIAFSNNSLIDGIVAFRRNVNGALKGQSECAICYAIVGPDKQLPTKKCGTCKNLFHGSCLYRWFKSSNSSSCPLCRNAFNYT